MLTIKIKGIFLLASLLLSACQSSPDSLQSKQEYQLEQQENTVEQNRELLSKKSYYGTQLPFASEAVYFLMTDRFVDGDSSNNFPNQGGQYPTYRRPINSQDGRSAFVGYMGGDFKGILDNASYIKNMGFTAIWLTPIVDQPDQAFAGGEPITFAGAFKDGGKTGYHGYWGDNFFTLDEHLPSFNLNFNQLTTQLRDKYELKTVLDIVLNHGSPAFSMQAQQKKFGQIFDADWQLIADHENLAPQNLNPSNPLHNFYNKKTEIAQLSDINESNPEVMKYFVKAYLQWIDRGADAFRIDTIKHMPHSFWKKFSDEIRKIHPNYFMFAESYSFDADFIAQHTFKQNGGVSVLDFPGREAITKTFEDPNSDYSALTSYLHLTDGTYYNPYELMTFYDNHDMARMNANENGFVDAHNWLFTSRGIPVIYYGSEVAFMAGTQEHQGNRNYFGTKNIARAKTSQIHAKLSQIANLRKNNIALQKGIQINLQFAGDKASFYRIYQFQGVNQTALVLLNKGDKRVVFDSVKYLSSGNWQDMTTGKNYHFDNSELKSFTVPPHSVKVLILNELNRNLPLNDLLNHSIEITKKLY